MNSELSQEQYEWFRDYVERATAIVLDEGKEYLVQSRLEGVLKAEELEDVDSLIKELSGPRRLRLHGAVVDAMTTNETSFFRDGHPFDALRQRILPDVQKRRQSAEGAGLPSRIRLLSAGCSTGEEPYTLAMVACDWLLGNGRLARDDVRIVAVDVSRADGAAR